MCDTKCHSVHAQSRLSLLSLALKGHHRARLTFCRRAWSGLELAPFTVHCLAAVHLMHPTESGHCFVKRSAGPACHECIVFSMIWMTMVVGRWVIRPLHTRQMQGVCSRTCMVGTMWANSLPDHDYMHFKLSASTSAYHFLSRTHHHAVLFSSYARNHTHGLCKLIQHALGATKKRVQMPTH